MRILLINDDLPPEVIGGSGRVVLEVSRELAKRSHQVTILTSTHAPLWSKKVEGVEVIAISALPVRFAHYRSVFSWKRAEEILQCIHAVQPDIIHAHGIAWQMGYLWIAAAAEKTPCFYTAHGMMHVSYGKVLGNERMLLWNDLKRARWTYNPLRNIFIRRFLARTRMITVSDALQRYLAECHSYRNMLTIHNGIDLHFWKRTQSKEQARRALGLPEGVPLFLLAGRLGHDKGLNLLLRLWPRLQGKARLVLVGRIPPLPATSIPLHYYREQSAEQMRTFYEAVDCTLVPSLCFDCLPTTSLESMASGTPAILGNRGGGPEEVDDGVTGWVIDPIQEETLLHRLQWCSDHHTELPSIGARASAFMQAHFSLEHHVDRLLELYRDSLVS